MAHVYVEVEAWPPSVAGSIFLRAACLWHACLLALTAGHHGIGPRCTDLGASGQAAHRFDALLESGSLSISGLPRGCASRAGHFARTWRFVMAKKELKEVTR